MYFKVALLFEEIIWNQLKKGVWYGFFFSGDLFSVFRSSDDVSTKRKKYLNKQNFKKYELYSQSIFLNKPVLFNLVKKRMREECKNEKLYLKN